MTVVHLLDVNVLIALLDPAHLDHDRAHVWFQRSGRKAFATCPITENGLLRIVGHPKYPNSPGPPGHVLAALQAMHAAPGHHFWSDSLSLAETRHVDPQRLSSHSSVTDVYLLALAVEQGGRLATMDQRLNADAVHGGRAALVLI